ncbi:hypothetical protein FRC04_009212 [Tulasnella sp. 424]|nr:hypothetical protein FRC04_009212 [Tulasnella sp. 424]KAG8973566.1 hypothetical protein FRC05_008634 [Tulasnella sp. 425]
MGLRAGQNWTSRSASLRQSQYKEFTHTVRMADLTLSLNVTTTPFPWATLVTAYSVSANVEFDVDATAPSLQTRPQQISMPSSVNFRLVVRGDSTKSANFISTATTLPTVTTCPGVVAVLDNLDDHSAYRTFLVGHSIAVADIWV